MGRTPCCSKVGLHRGAWSSDEDKLLISHIQTHGEGQWRALPSKAGLLRCGKSCRLRWMNYLRPGIKRGNFTSDENDAIFRLRSLHGNRWSLIAAELPGRTDNEIKNYWNAHLRKTLQTHHPKPSRTTKKLQKNKKSAAEHEHAQKEHKSTEVKLLESGPMSSNSSSLPSLCSSGASSSCTVDVGGGEFEFPWSNWSPFMEGEEGEFSLMDGWDLVSSKGDESLMFENLYHEYLNLLNDQEGVDEDNSN